MFFIFGKPDQLDLIDIQPDLDIVKRQTTIAVLDDELFQPGEALRVHNFQIHALGGDIRNLDQINQYPVVVCDVSGVGLAFGSKDEGAHVIREARKQFPDKYLIAYTGMTHSIRTTNALAAADKRMAKDEPIDAWIKNLEVALKEVSNPKQRWLRLRRQLLEQPGVELHQVLKLEQAYIKSVLQKKKGLLEKQVAKLPWNNDLQDVVTKFAAYALVAFFAG